MKRLQEISKELDEMIRFISIHKDTVLNVLDDFSVAISLSDENKFFVKVNKAFAELFGYSPDEMIGESIEKILSKDEKEDSLKIYTDSFANKSEYTRIIMDAQRKDGSHFPVIYSAKNIETKDKKTLRLAIFSDISDLSETQVKVKGAFSSLQNKIITLEEKIVTQELAESIFLHDIKKPFNNILGICDILDDEEGLSEELKMWHKTIREICEKGLEQTETLHGIGQMERGDFAPQIKSLNAVEFFEKLIPELNQLAGSKDIRIDLSNKEKLAEVKEECCFEGDVVYLKLMFSNLLLNAVEASPENNNVTINLERNEDRLLVSIHNEGEVPAKIKDNFFDKFVTSGKSRGTGLGTYIAKLITQVHKGNIILRSSAEEGTTVMVDLPVCHETQ